MPNGSYTSRTTGERNKNEIQSFRRIVAPVARASRVAENKAVCLVYAYREKESRFPYLATALVGECKSRPQLQRIKIQDCASKCPTRERESVDFFLRGMSHDHDAWRSLPKYSSAQICFVVHRFSRNILELEAFIGALFLSQDDSPNGN